MSNIIGYVRKYGDKTFLEEPFNEIDNLVLCHLAYLNYDGIVSNEKKYISIHDAGHKFLKQNKYRMVSKLGIPARDSYKLLREIVDTKRYKDILMYNYIYVGDINTQFSAVTFKVTDDLIYVAYEGTDYLLSGWKEDFYMVYMFPVPSHKLAIKYLNKTISIFDKNVIVGGHSKGGNLSLVASMYVNPLKRMKIRKIYSNDGQGLRYKQINSRKFKRIKNKYVHIMPNYDIVGILFRNDHDCNKIIKSNKKSIFAHAIFTWQIDDNELIPANLCLLSKNLEKSMIKWLDNHNDKQRKIILNSIFETLEENGVVITHDIISFRKMFKIIRGLKNIDRETKKLALDFIKFNITYLIENRKGDSEN